MFRPTARQSRLRIVRTHLHIYENTRRTREDFALDFDFIYRSEYLLEHASHFPDKLRSESTLILRSLFIFLRNSNWKARKEKCGLHFMTLLDVYLI